MGKEGKSFIEILREWKNHAWHMFASQSIRKNTKYFWCKKNETYKVTLKSRKEPVYQGSDMEKACKVYEAL